MEFSGLRFCSDLDGSIYIVCYLEQFGLRLYAILNFLVYISKLSGLRFYSNLDGSIYICLLFWTIWFIFMNWLIYVSVL